MSFDLITNPTKYSDDLVCTSKKKENVKKLLGIDDSNIKLDYQQQYKEEEGLGWKFDETNVAKVEADCKSIFFEEISFSMVHKIDSEKPRFDNPNFLASFYEAFQHYGVANGLELIKFLLKI